MTACKKQSQNSSFEATVSYVWETIVWMHPPEFQTHFAYRESRQAKCLWMHQKTATI